MMFPFDASPIGAPLSKKTYGLCFSGVSLQGSDPGPQNVTTEALLRASVTEVPDNPYDI